MEKIIYFLLMGGQVDCPFTGKFACHSITTLFRMIKFLNYFKMIII